MPDAEDAQGAALREAVDGGVRGTQYLGDLGEGDDPALVGTPVGSFRGLHCFPSVPCLRGNERLDGLEAPMSAFRAICWTCRQIRGFSRAGSAPPSARRIIRRRMEHPGFTGEWEAGRRSRALLITQSKSGAPNELLIYKNSQ